MNSEFEVSLINESNSRSRPPSYRSECKMRHRSRVLFKAFPSPPLDARRNNIPKYKRLHKAIRRLNRQKMPYEGLDVLFPTELDLERKPERKDRLSKKDISGNETCITECLSDFSRQHPDKPRNNTPKVKTPSQNYSATPSPKAAK